MLHVELCTEMSDIAKEVLGLCEKDLISSKAKYHGSCYKMFLRVVSKSSKNFVDEDFNDIRGSGLNDVYDSVYEFCEKLIKSSPIDEFKEITKLMQDEANKGGIEIPQSDYNNLTRKSSNKFKELQFVHQEHNKVLVFPTALKTEELVSEYHSLKANRQRLKFVMRRPELKIPTLAKWLISPLVRVIIKIRKKHLVLKTNSNINIYNET